MRQNCLIYLELSWYHSSEWLLANPKNSNSNSDSHTQLVLHPGNWAAHLALARLRTLRHLGHRFLEWWNRRRDWKPSPVRLVVVAARYHLDPFKVPWFTMVYHNILSKFEIHIDPYWSVSPLPQELVAAQQPLLLCSLLLFRMLRGHRRFLRLRKNGSVFGARVSMPSRYFTHGSLVNPQFLCAFHWENPIKKMGLWSQDLAVQLLTIPC